jgi:hypothetical protein
MATQRCLAIALTVLVTLTIHASSFLPLDLQTLPAQTTLIVTGYVVETRTIRGDKSTLEKLSTVRVVTVLKGTYAKRTLRIRTRTGFAFFDRHLRPGDSGVFFLTPSTGSDFEAAYPGSFALFENGAVAMPKVMHRQHDRWDRRPPRSVAMFSP